MWAFFTRLSVPGESEEAGKARLQRNAEDQESGIAGRAR